jgi:hypothetical protein
MLLHSTCPPLTTNILGKDSFWEYIDGLTTHVFNFKHSSILNLSPQCIVSRWVWAHVRLTCCTHAYEWMSHVIFALFAHCGVVNTMNHELVLGPLRFTPRKNCQSDQGVRGSQRHLLRPTYSLTWSNWFYGGKSKLSALVEKGRDH